MISKRILTATVIKVREKLREL